MYWWSSWKPLAEGTAARLAEGLGGALLLVALRPGDVPGDEAARASGWAAGLLLACGLCWVAATAAFWRRHHMAEGGHREASARMPDS